ncbi:choice-of-anchor P family protein [Streptomyces sp. SAS_270]|uniref:choice-of-anchor P family protein n=1 Tax=Streptomyces sp. SAS_270 TaxID=3412748 RepID=UPI00403D4F42
MNRPRANRRAARVLTVLAAVTALGTGSLGTAQASDQSSGPTTGSTTEVTYRGHEFTVPASWQVVDLDKHPEACVRLDRHAVYLGTPSVRQHCPADVTGRTEALLVQPAEATAGAERVTENRTARTYRATADRIAVTAAYGSDRTEIRRILRSAGLPVAAAKAEQPSQAPSALAVPADATSFQGKGFDACTAPSQATMDAWKADSPYGAIGIYIGGVNRGCSQANLSAQWVQTQYTKGWRFFPIYVGPQAEAGSGSCTGDCQVITDPAPQGIAAADDAAAQAGALGLGQGSVLYNNLEQYNRGGAVTARVLTYLDAYTKRLHELGYRSGAYGSVSSLVTDLVANAGAVTLPDVIDFARWNDQATTDDPAIPANLWADHQRIHQYAGDQRETHGGVTIGIDRNQLDVGAGGTPQPPQPKDTKLAWTGPGTVSNGSPAKLSATLTTDTGEPVAERKVSFTLGAAQTCEGTTDAQGAANCTIASVDQPLNADATVPVKAAFAGDDAYKASAVAATVKLQYVTGRAYGLSAAVSLLGLPIGIQPTPDTGTVRTAGAGATAPPCTSNISVLVINARTLCAKVESKVGPSSATSTASLEEASIGLPGLPVLGLSGIKAVSTSSCTAVTGSTDLKLTVAGVEVKLDGAPDTTVDLGVVGTKLVVNEQVKVDGGLTVNAAHLTAPGVDVVVASSTTAAHNCG